VCVDCCNALLAAGRLNVRKTVVCVVFVLSLLATVHLTSLYRISDAQFRQPFVGVLSTNQMPRTAGQTGARSRDVNESTAAVIAVNVDGNFTGRVERFNLELYRLRHQLLVTPRRSDFCATTDWNQGSSERSERGTGTICSFRAEKGCQKKRVFGIFPNVKRTCKRLNAQ